MVELRQLRYFVAVAEELHFTRAAERLGMAQPPLSQQILRLEAELGIRLFARTKRRVELTEAGRVLLDGARRTLAEADRAVREAQRAGRGEVGRLAIGFVGSATYEVLPRLLAVYHRQFPDVDIVPRQATTTEQVHLINRGDLQVGLIRPPIDDPGIATRVIASEPLVAALPEGHPLVERTTIDLRDLADEPFILFPRHLGPGAWDQIMRLCHAAGFTARVEQEAVEMHTITGLVAAGMGVSLVPGSVQHLRSVGVVYRPLAGETATWDLALAWRHDDESPVVAALLRLCSTLVDDTSDEQAGNMLT